MTKWIPLGKNIWGAENWDPQCVCLYACVSMSMWKLRKQYKETVDGHGKTIHNPRWFKGNPEYRVKNNYLKFSLQGICRNLGVDSGLPHGNKVWRSDWRQFYLDLKRKEKPNDICPQHQFILVVVGYVAI